MPMNIIVSEQCDRLLDELAPAYLKGNKKSAQRVEWAVERLAELLANGDNKTTDPKPASSST